MNISAFLKTPHQVYCIIRVKEGTSLTGRFQSGPIKVSRFESSKSFPTYHQLLIAFNSFLAVVNSVSTTFICSSFASPPTNFVDIILLVHQGVHLLLQLGRGEPNSVLFITGEVLSGQQLPDHLLTTQCKVHAQLENCIWETAGHCFFFSHREEDLANLRRYFFISWGISFVGKPEGYPLRASPIIHPSFQALTTSLFFYATAHLNLRVTS